MSQYVLTIVDTTGIQPYIFNSNRLRENIGASYLVNQATNQWVKDKLAELDAPENGQQESIQESGLASELIYASGGNAMIIFCSMEKAREFTRKLSRYVLKQAPGINLVAAHKEFDWQTSLLKEVVQELMDNDLEQQKRARIPSSPLLGLSVTASCASTQLVAVDTSEAYLKEGEEESTRLISKETRAKLKAVSTRHEEPANKALKDQFEDIIRHFDFPYKMDFLGRSKEESSYYAVVHADGNGMGERFKALGEIGQMDNHQDPNRVYINAMRELSDSVDKAGLKAMRKVIEILINSIEDNQVMGKFELKDNYLPIRPLVYGGDDVTFICDGRLGLELAALYLKSFSEQAVADNQPLTACAGVSIVKSHYPFARAYALSEALCANAKKFVKEYRNQLGEKRHFSAIDWHIAASGLFGSLNEIRQREYTVTAGNLTLRPVLNDKCDKWRTWSNFTEVVQTFNEDKDWKGRRNKIIALREKLRDGPKAVEQFRKAYRIDELPQITSSDIDVDTLRDTGWTEQRCGYFDAIEAMEFYFPLNQGEANDSLSTENETAE
jgi:hypothetical protein